ncbi:MAG: leucine-rich repeat domain-containing protein [Propionibacteriaceae bacterium]|nr:leucine-rich repeat domain-containing protein [Propionibacteriaceae bacterium]
MAAWSNSSPDSLSCSSRSITSLEGLQYLNDPDLTALSLAGNQISDLTPLADMTALTMLSLDGNQISDLTPLAGLTNLYQLSLSSNQISDIAPLANLPRLTSLKLTDNQISDLAGLTNLTGLTWLYLTDNQISNLTPLAGLTMLQYLFLDMNQISDLTPLAKLTGLAWLRLSANPVSNLAPLAELSTMSRLDVTESQISDLAPLANLTGLTTLYLADNQICNLTPLTDLRGLRFLHLSDNQINDVTAVAGLTRLAELDLSNNQIAEVAPLGTLVATDADLWKLYLDRNDISDITPLAAWINTSTPFDPMVVDAERIWTLAGNQITDVSSLDWATVNQAWATLPSEYSTEVSNYAVTNQTITTPAVVGTTVALPIVKTATSDPHPIAWSVKSGNATIDQTVGTITYNAVGPVVLAWGDQFTTICRDSSYTGGHLCSPGQPDPITVSFFSGTVNVNVTPAPVVTPPVPSVPASTATTDGTQGSATGGAARLADGTDAYTLVTTLNSADGQPLTGYAGDLTVVPSSPDVTVTAVVDQGDGTYTVTAASAQPGSYTVTIALDGAAIGSPIPVNFIAASIANPSVTAGTTQTATGSGFLPGEPVVARLHADLVNLGTFTADAAGKVTVTFAAPSTTGRHTVDFIGETSGTVYAAFDVVAPATVPDVPSVPESTAVRDDIQVSTTGGAARLADGTDAYTLVTTLNSADGQPLTGYAGDLTAVPSSPNVTVTAFVDQGDGTYTVAVAAAQPGNYSVTIALDGTPIGEPIPVNFIAADIARPSVAAGASQTSDGLGFLPGEQVVAWLHSTPVNLGTLTADANGKVTVTFTAPSTTGRHTVEFIGQTSGTVYAAFDVVAAAKVPGGGTALPQTNTTMALVLMFGLIASAGFTLTMARRARHSH